MKGEFIMKKFNNQEERLNFLIRQLLGENSEYKNFNFEEIKKMRIEEKKKIYRGLVNLRIPIKEKNNELIEVENEYLQEKLKNKKVTELFEIEEIQKDIYLWKGDITLLKVDAIVNAANSRMLGCFVPNHACIDNCIHTFAGIQLREECNEIMLKQGRFEQTGKAKITLAYNLPCKFVIHTVGPIILNKLSPVSEEDKQLLKNCYISCLELAVHNNLKSIAFCCISTGEFHFPNKLAANIAIDTVKEFKMKNKSDIKIVFNVFKDLDFDIYDDLLK